MNQDIFVTKLKEIFLQNANPEIAQAQSAYMKNLFTFCGLPKPLRASISKEILKEIKINNEEELIILIKKLWAEQNREYHYLAIELLNKYHKLWTINILDLILHMIQTNSWWDSVDALAAKSMGLYLQKFTEKIKITDNWIKSDNLWLKRTAILFQLKYKEKTDSALLFNYCKLVMHEKEFFIRKAIGWALREYSKTNAPKVKNFIEENRNHLSYLSIKEASKYI